MKWYPVRMYFPENLKYGLPADIHEDEIRGINPLNALQNAAWNWPAAEWIELV